MTSAVIPDSVALIGDYAFYACASLTSMVIPDSVTSIGIGVFSDCRTLTNVVIGDSVTSIDGYAFRNCISLTSMVIPDSVTSIGEMAFAYCYNLKNVYYKGIVEDWNKISISHDNSYLTNATRYYYSESKPTEKGNYWHYDVDGKTPIIW